MTKVFNGGWNYWGVQFHFCDLFIFPQMWSPGPIQRNLEHSFKGGCHSPGRRNWILNMVVSQSGARSSSGAKVGLPAEGSGLRTWCVFHEHFKGSLLYNAGAHSRRNWGIPWASQEGLGLLTGYYYEKMLGLLGGLKWSVLEELLYPLPLRKTTQRGR